MTSTRLLPRDDLRAKYRRCVTLDDIDELIAEMYIIVSQFNYSKLSPTEELQVEFYVNLMKYVAYVRRQ